jgi:N-acetylneuraminate lyase
MTATARPTLRLTGLVAAAHTPFHDDGALNLSIVEKQAAHLLANRITCVFIAGSTGESHSLNTDERRALAQRWLDVARGSALRVIVHVGSNCLTDAAALARHAQDNGALAVAALTPSYFKPASVAALVDCCAQIAAAVPELPFYHYDIPVLTNVNLSMPDFLAQAGARIPNLAGLKFTNPDLMAYQLCLRAEGGRFDVPWGLDEVLVAALTLGARGAVGSSYNFAAPIYHKLIAAFQKGDLAAAREQQFLSVRLIQTVAKYGYMGAAKAVMGMLGVNVGPARLPNRNPTEDERCALRKEMEPFGLIP